MTEATVTKKSKNAKAPKLFPDELIDQLLAQIQNKDAESVLGESGLAGQLKKQLAERMLAAELTHHLESEAKQGKAGNHRNGTSRKTVITPNGELNLDIPRDAMAIDQSAWSALRVDVGRCERWKRRRCRSGRCRVRF